MNNDLPISPYILKGLGILMLCMAMGTSSLWAQTASVSANGSDYNLTLYYTDVPANTCNCSMDGQNIIGDDLFGPFPFNPKISVVDITNPTDSITQGGFGPDYSAQWRVVVLDKGEKDPNTIATCTFPLSCSDLTNLAPQLTVTTERIKAPIDVSASSTEAQGSRLDQIKITWDKGTDIPDADHKYYIYRFRGGYTLIDSTDGNVREYTDTGLTADTDYTYAITTYTPSAGAWGWHESDLASDLGKTAALNLTVSQGTFANKTKISWNSVASSSDNIRIERSIPKSNPIAYEELGILNKNATAYTDTDAIPGFSYTYRASALDGNGDDLVVVTGTGYRQANGKISGRVTASGGAGVSDIDVTVVPLNTVTPAGVNPVPVGGYSTTTDINGYYEIPKIYYYDSATFTVIPSYIPPGGDPHTFNPTNQPITLDLTTFISTNIDFIDENAISVFGKVEFPSANSGAWGPDASGDPIPVQGVRIIVDTLDLGITTNRDGAWSYAVTNAGTYRFSASYKGHKFEINSNLNPNNPSGDTAYVTVAELDIQGVDFTDLAKDTIFVRVQDACGDPLPVQANAQGSTARVRILHDRGQTYFEKEVGVDANGRLQVELPASDFQVIALDDPPFSGSAAADIWDQLKDTTMKFDLSLRDSMEITTEIQDSTITPERTVNAGGVITVLPADTTIRIYDLTRTVSIRPEANFIYLGELIISINWADAGADIFDLGGCQPTTLDPTKPSQVYLGSPPSGELILLETVATYPLDIVIEAQTPGGVNSCPVEIGEVTLYDYIGDQEKTPTRLAIQNGHVYYDVEPGIPNTTPGGLRPYQKLFFVSVKASLRPIQDEAWWALLKGTKQFTPSFVSVSPEFPDLIVHDPPGDNSYAWVEKGSSYTTSSNTQVEVSGSAGGYIDAIVLGTKTTSGAGLIITMGGGLRVAAEIQGGRNNFDKKTTAYTYTFTENYSTSSDPLFTGHDGDVYIGKSFNQIFAEVDVLEFDEGTCIAEVKTDVGIEPEFNTAFIYTEKHVRDVLVPQIKYLLGLIKPGYDSLTPAEQGMQAGRDLHRQINIFERSIITWDSIMAKNALYRDADAVEASPNKNISFSAGATYQAVAAYDDAGGYSYEYVEFIDEELKLAKEWVLESPLAWSEGQAGFAQTFRHSFTKEASTDSTNTFVVGYEFADKDIGDVFSVDILTDPAFNVPAFRLVSGTSSCPQEEGTRPRDGANINIFPPQIDNVPREGSAVFLAQLINESESRETRAYQVRVIPQTNPGGAVVTLGGQNISNSPISYFLGYSNDPNNATEADLTVEAGPRATNYEIDIMMYPPCEYELWESGGSILNADTFTITVNFESECSNVALSNPQNNWLVNGNSADQLIVDFSGYDLNNPKFQSVTLEYKLETENWADGPTIEKGMDSGQNDPNDPDSLDLNSYRLFWDVSGLLDGKYQIRARANCEKSETHSSPLSGQINRSSIAPFGTPVPSDGFLRFGQDISITFDKPIKCGFVTNPAYNPVINLIRTDDSTQIPIEIQCSGNTLILKPGPNIDIFSMPDLAGVPLVAYVSGMLDLQDNVQEVDVEWTFLVNVSPVFWDPDSVNQAFAANTAPTFNSMLKNTSVLTKVFEITAYPAWLTPSILSGSVLSESEYEVSFQVSPGLPIGVYRDTVTAMIDGWPEYLDITYEAYAIQPNWKVNAEKYDYSMSMILAFSLDQTDSNLSRDDRDLVAAIFNGEIRGVAQLEYVSRFNKYLAFLTVHSNIPANEEISFSLWRASSGVEYIAEETYYFASEQVYGQINNPEILHTDGVFQVIPLKQGWNWVSLNVTNTDMTVKNLLNSLGSPDVGNNITVKRKDNATATYTQIATPIIYGNQWTGSLVQLDNKQAYLIHLSDAPDTLRVPGNPITNFSNINVLAGWNWIGFQPQSAQPIHQALGSVNLRNLDLLKGQQAFSQYHRGTDTWFGPLQFMEPGKGYKLKLKDGQIYNNLVYSRLGLKDFEVDHTRYESSMTLIGSVGLEERAEIREERLLVGAFIDDTCRGYGFLEYVEFLQEYRVVFSLAGNASDLGRPVTFKLYDTQSGQEFIPDNEPEVYISDRILGDMNEPYVLFDRLALPAAGYFLEQNYPNPYDSKTNIRFILPQTGQVKLTVYDQFGKTVKVLIDGELSAGEHTAIFEAGKLPSGVYHYSIEAGDYRASRKMVKF